MKTGATIAVNTIALSVSTAATVCIALGFNIFLARAIGVERFGEFSFALSFIALFSTFVEFSLDSVIVRDVARTPTAAGAYFGNTIVLKIIFFLLTFVLIVTATGIIGYPGHVRMLLYILGAGLLFDAVKKSCFSLFNAAQQMHYPAILLVVERLLFTLFGLVAITLQGSVLILGLCYVAAQAITQVFTFILIQWELGIKPEQVEYRFSKRLVQQASSFFAISVIAAAYTDIDKLLLFSMQDGIAVGLYAAVYKLVTIPTRLTNAFHRAVYPVLSKHAASTDRRLLAETYRKSMRYLMLGAFPLAIGITILAEPIISTLYGEAYVSGAAALQILIWASVLEFFNPFLSRILYAMERQRSVLAAAISGTGLNIVLNLLLIPHYSFVGAAIATLLSAILIFVQLISVVHRLIPNVYFGTLVLKLLLAGMIMWLACFLLGDLPILLLALLGIVTYCVCLILTGTFSHDDVVIFRRILHVKSWRPV